MRGSFKLGKVAGIGVFVHWTFAILIAYIIFNNYRLGYNANQMIWSLIFIISIFGTVFLHELGHALAAKYYGIQTKDITLLPIGGLARLASIPEKPKEELIVALAGPLVNILLALISLAIISFPNVDQYAIELSQGVNAENFMIYFFMVNIWLAVFNLIPAFPMDGGRVLRALLSFKLQRHVATKIAARIGQILAIGFVFAGFYLNPFLVFIGLFIFMGAQGESEITSHRFIISDYKVKDVLMTNFVTLQINDSLRIAINLLLDGQAKDFIVQDGNKIVGTLGRDDLLRGIENYGKDEKISSLLKPITITLSEEQPLEEAYLIMQQNSSGIMPVMHNNQLVGVLDMENILEFIMIKNATEKNEKNK